MNETGRRTYDAIVVGGGHNGLVCAAYLARGGLRTLVLERRPAVGGTVTTSELAPGVRVPTLAHTVGRLRPSIVRDLRLRAHGLRLAQPDVRAIAPALDGPPVALFGDPARTAAGLPSRSAADARRWVELDRHVRALGSVLAAMMEMTPPDPSHPGLRDAVAGLRLGARYRGLREDDARALLRVLPMPVADFLEERLEDDALRAAVAYRGILYSALSPTSAGSTQLLLADLAGTDGGAAGQTVFALGGPATLAEALLGAARAVGVEVRTDSDVVAVRQRGERVTGVALRGGEELDAPIVVSALDPKRTLLELIDPETLGPVMGWRAGNLRLGGVLAKVNLALTGLPAFGGVAADEAERLLRGRIVIAPSMRWLESAASAAKYGRVSDEPLLEATIPSLVDPSLVEGGGRIRHVMSVLVQSAPYALRDGDWESGREPLGDRVVATLERFARGFGALVAARQVITPVDLERDHGLTGGHPFHGEPALDAWFAWRPMLGLARHRLPVAGLYLASAGAHPGGGVTGGPGRNASREILGDARRGVTRGRWRLPA